MKCLLLIAVSVAVVAPSSAERPKKRRSPVAAIAKKIHPALVTVRFVPAESAKDGGKPVPGAGVIAKANGIVLVPAVEAADGSKLEVRRHDGSKLPAKVLATDRKLGVAILKIAAPKPLAEVEFGDSDQVKVGDDVIEIGGTFGYELSVATGVISAANRAGPNGIKVLQVDSSVSPGISPGPVFDMKGRLLGIVPKSGGIGLAVPSNRLKELMMKATKQQGK